MRWRCTDRQDSSQVQTGLIHSASEAARLLQPDTDLQLNGSAFFNVLAEDSGL